MENETSFKLLFWSFTIILFMISGGVMWLFQHFYHRDIRRIKPEEQQKSDIAFSDVEMQIIDLTFKGHTAEETANKLCVSSKTVEYHKKKMMERTGAKNFLGVIHYVYKKEK